MIREISASDFLKLISNTQMIKEVILPPKGKLPKLLEGLCFEQVDFNHPILGGFLSKPVIRKCTFMESNFDGINAEKSLFEDSVFNNVVFGKRFVGRIDNSKFINCSFNNCQFSDTMFETDFFEKCNFNDCKFTKINFNNCNLKKVTFSGSFKSVNWVKCVSDEVDVSNVDMKDVSLIDSESYDIKLPNNKNNFVVYGKDFECAEAELKEKLSAKTFEEFCYMAKFISEHFLYGTIIDEDFVRNSSKAEKKIIMEVLFSCSNTK